MPENEQQSGLGFPRPLRPAGGRDGPPPPPALRPPSDPAPSSPAPPPQPVDPEQVRQFQQFQQFQELMRQQGGGALLPPAPQRPLWQRILRGKLVRKLALLAIVLLGLYFAYDYYFGDDNENLPASMTGGGTNKENRLHAETPKQTVRLVYGHIAQNDRAANEYEFVCGQFEGGAEQQFAANFGAATCQEAVGKLFAQIDKTQQNWRNTYAEPFPGAELAEVPKGIVEVSSCPLPVRPRLGAFTLREIEGGQWVIIGHRLETC